MIVVFVGPTLSADAARALLPGAAIRPPAAQGDLYRATLDGARAIGLVDGLFLDVPSVWHREVLHALTRGVHVFGAASMGALRAAELDGFGMRGAGAIYAAYRDGAWPGCDGPFEDDDEVAVVHAPPEAGGGALSDSMADLRATVLAAEAAGFIGPARRETLIAEMRGLHYPSRSFARLAEAEPALAAWLPAGAVHQKRRDAEQMLREIAAFLAGDPGPHGAGFALEPAQVWEAFVAAERARGIPPEAARVLDALRLDPVAWRAALRSVLGRDRAPAPASQDERRRQLARLRQTHRLWRRAELDGWMQANGLDETSLGRLLDAEAALDVRAEHARAGPAHAGLDAALVEHLRATGAYVRLLTDAPAADAPAHWPDPAALEWHFGRLGIPIPPDVTVWAAETGWRTRARFDKAVASAYRSAMMKRGGPA